LLAFLISAARAMLEVLALCLLGQAVLYLVAGQGRSKNPIYRLFELITGPPRQFVALLLPRSFSPLAIGALTLAIALLFWLGLAFLRKFV
jgi:hypothetical protein